MRPARGALCLAILLQGHETLALKTAPRFSDFHSLTSPEGFTTLLASSKPEDVTVVKYTSDQCRTCRAAKARIRSVVKTWDAENPPPRANFYSMSIRSRNDTHMLEFFKKSGITHLPYIELYVGGELRNGLVVPPSRTAFLRNALTDVTDQWRVARRQRVRRKLLESLREHRHELRAQNRRYRRLRRRWALIKARGLLDQAPERRRRRWLGQLQRAIAQRRDVAHANARLERRYRLFRRLVVLPGRA